MQTGLEFHTEVRDHGFVIGMFDALHGFVLRAFHSRRGFVTIENSVLKCNEKTCELSRESLAETPLPTVYAGVR